MKHMLFEADIKNTQKVTDYVKEEMQSFKAESKDIQKTMLLSEELFVKLCEAADENAKIDVRVKKHFGTIKVSLSGKGQKLIAAADSNTELLLSEMEASPAAEAAIRNIILSLNADALNVSYRSGVNKAVISVGGGQSGIVRTLIALGAAIVFGLLCKLLLPAGAQSWLNDNVLVTVKTLFINALKMIMCPVIFFSIASCVGSFTDLRELGKIGGKVMGFYTFTTVVAVVVGFLSFNLFAPGSFGEFCGTISGEIPVAETEISMLSTLINIVPSNLIAPFAEADTLQLIFLAILIGAAAAGLGQSQAKVSEFLSCGNDLFMKVASIITKGIPVMLFASVSSMILSFDLSQIASIGTFAVTVVVGDFVLLAFYCAMVALFARTNPVAFIKNAIGAWLNAFALCSSNAAMPGTMKTCDENLHVHPKLYSFSIPLGATINMDGLSLLLTVSTIFFAKVFGVEFGGKDYISLIVMAMILSAGTPGIPGSGIICMSVLLARFSIPMEALAVFTGIYSIVDTIGTANNVMGDMVGTYIIAKRNGYMKDTK